MWPLLFLGLLGCVGAPDASPDVAPPPRPRDLRLDAPWIVAGDRAALTVTGAPAGATVWFAVSGAGLGSGPCPAAIGSCLDVRNPITVLGSAVADAAGVAQYAVRMPNPAPAFAAFQAAILGSPGLVSNPLPRWLLPAGTPLGDALDADGDGWTQGGGDCDDASAAVTAGPRAAGTATT
ncbi:MAG TPA: hypothetical protein PKA64_15220, partial [Myxococcota bacterium]|nr:hypothetical protein [Myxococcota bacterium]